MRGQSRTVEEIIGRLASRQHGVVSRIQLLQAGISSREIERRLASGALIRVYRGVYRVGHRAPSIDADHMAAVLACGSGSLLCGRAAGYAYAVVKGSPPRPEVATPTERRVPGVVTRRCRTVDVRDATTLRRIPIRTVAAVLVDLAGDLGRADLARACHEAGVRYRTTPRQVAAVLERRRTAKGARVLREILWGDVPVSLSALEARFLELLIEAGLPLPETNKVASGRRVDCRWPEYGLTVELNSYLYHGSRHAWEMDYRRMREAYARKDEFRAYTYADVFEDPTQMLAELRALLVG
jgi:hypothetical protein